MNSYNFALLQIHLTAVLFGLTGVLGAVIQSSADVLVLGRVITAGVALLVYFAAKKQAFYRLSLNTLKTQGFLGLLLTCHWLTFYIAVKEGGVAIATLGFAGFPAFAALAEVLIFKEKLRRREIGLLISIFIGLIIITPKFEFGNHSTQGLLWGILSGAFNGLLAVLNRKNTRKLSGTQAGFWQYLTGVLILLPFTGTKLADVPAIDWFWIACLGLLCTGLAYSLFISSLRHLKARTAAMIISLEPVYAILIAWFWLGQVPTLRMILGGTIILVSVAMTNIKK